MRLPAMALAICLIGAAAAPVAALGPEDVQLQRVWSGVGFTAPLFLAAAPGDPDNLYVVLQDGRILAVDRNPSATSAATFLDIRGRVNQNGGEMGLLGLAFDPDYAENRRFYVNYVTRAPLRTMVARYLRTASPLTADPDSEHELLSYAQPATNHNGGWIGFGPDRHLYIASGDGGSYADQLGNAQSLGTPLGKVLRIRRDGSIPADNPFVGIAGARGEVWAYGLRNPFRMSFDQVRGELWAGDVGAGNWEEIDQIVRGGNYGWNVYEGNHPYVNPDDLPASAFDAPVHEYSHDDGCSVIGGVVYRGAGIPALAGYYVYTDYCSGTLWALQAVDGVLRSNVVIGRVSGGPTSIGEDQDGELYITTRNGAIYRVLAGDGTAEPDFPALLSQTGLFEDTAALEPAPDMIEYAVNAAFWSDRADKRRWFRLPPDGRIRFNTVSAWRLPVGSATVKHFEMDMADGSRRRLETRVFLRRGAGWRGATYRWNSGQTDARLVTATETETIEVLTAQGQVREQLYEYPSQSNCLRCHTGAAGVVLGLNTPQLNRAFGSPSRNQIRRFSQAGLFTTVVGDPAQYPKLANPGNTSLPLERRARAWLHVNCAQCHRPGGPTGVDMDLRWTRPLEDTRTVGVAPSGDTLGIAGAKRIAPGDPRRSLVWQRIRRTDAHRMPPIGSHVVQASGVKLIGDWIEAGPR